MKKKFIFLLLLAIGNYYLCQSFSIIELQSLTSKNWDDFDTGVTKKGYNYNTSTKEVEYEMKSYTFGRNKNLKSLSNFFITKYEYSDGSKLVSWQTNRLSDYIKIKEELKRTSFKYLNSETNNGVNAMYYQKDNKLLSLFSGSAKNEFGYDTDYYEISVTVR